MRSGGKIIGVDFSIYLIDNRFDLFRNIWKRCKPLPVRPRRQYLFGNLIAAIKFAKYNELTEKDYLVSIATDSMEL